MAGYRYESSRIGDLVLWEDKKLLVQHGLYYSNPCYHCFFNKRECTGVACLPQERFDRKYVIYLEITSIGR